MPRPRGARTLLLGVQAVVLASSRLTHPPSLVRVWRPGVRLVPYQRDAVWLLPNCAVASAFLRSLPDPHAPDAAWAPWERYLELVYGEKAARRVDIRGFNMFFGVATSWPPGNKSSALDCGRFVVHVPYLAAGMWPLPAVLVRRAGERMVAESNAWVEVYRSRHRLGPEGVGYGCWFYAARGTGQWVHLGRTRALRRRDAAGAFSLVRLPSGETQHMHGSIARLRMHYACVRAPPPAASRDELPLFVGAINLRDGVTKNKRLILTAERCAELPNAAELRLGDPAAGRMYVLPPADGVWALNARRAGYDSVQLYPSTRAGHVEVLLGTDACMYASVPIQVCPPDGVVIAGPDPARRQPCRCREPPQVGFYDPGFFRKDIMLGVCRASHDVAPTDRRDRLPNATVEMLRWALPPMSNIYDYY